MPWKLIKIPAWHWLGIGVCVVVLVLKGFSVDQLFIEVWFLLLIPGVILSYHFGFKGVIVNTGITAVAIALAFLGNLVFPSMTLPDPWHAFLAMSIFVAVSLAIGLMGESFRDRERKFQQLAVTDPLTGLYNRRYLAERLQGEVNRAQRHHLPLVVAILDLDEFKQINDTRGHLVGDEMLVQVSGILKNNVRKEDIAVRFGGDEFALVLPEVGEEGATAMVTRLARAVQERTGITLSVGMALFPRDAALPEELIAAADTALIMAKGRGKNQVAWFSPGTEGDLEV